MHTKEEKVTRLSELITEALEQQKMEILDFAKALDISYEHARRLARGQGAPGKIMLREISRILKLDRRVMETAYTADAIEKKYGGIPAELAGKQPGMDGIERAWPYLTPEQQTDLTQMATNWAKRNKAAARP